MKYIILVCLLFAFVITAVNFVKEEKEYQAKEKAKAARLHQKQKKDVVSLIFNKVETALKYLKKKFDHFFERTNNEFGGVLKTKTYEKGTKGFAHEYQPFYPKKNKKKN
jgi:hypothetical protein